MKRVSIIVPVWNVEQYLRKCLDSLVNQTFKDIEIVIINDSSPDNSQEIIDEYKKAYPDLISCYIKENGGQASARNLGLKKCHGEYITFVDSDDWVDTQMVEKMYNQAINTNSDIVVCEAYSVIDDNIKKLDIFKSDNSDVHKRYIINTPGACWGQLIKKDIIVNNDLYFLEHHFYEDIAVMPALCLFSKRITFMNENLYYYLVRTGSTMKQVKYSQSLEDIFDSLDYLSNIFIKNNAYQEYYTELEYIYIDHLLHAASLRFYTFKKFDQLSKIVDIMKQKYPKWKRNKYYKEHGIKYKIVCSLFYKKKYKLLKCILKG